MSAHPATPVRPNANHDYLGDRGAVYASLQECEIPWSHEIHVAGDNDDEDLDELEGDAEPQPVEQGEIIEMPEDSDEEDSAPRRTAPDPGEPTAEEVAEHRVDHIPYRCWCPHCVRGRGYGEQHRSGPESNVPTVAADYLLVTKKGV